MEYTNELLEARMVVKDAPSVRDQLRYRSQVTAMGGDNYFIIAWEAAKAFIEEWECPHVGLDDDLDEITNRKAADAISWGGMQVFQFYTELEEVSKN